MIDEEPDAAALFIGKEEEIERPNDAQWPRWASHIYAAWIDLRDDRHYGDMGGLGGIYFTAIDRYAQRFNICGTAFDNFLMFIRVLDEEYIRHVSEKQKTEQNKNKN